MSLRGESHWASRYHLPKHQLRQECRRRTCNQNDTVVEKCLCFARIAEPIEERKHYHHAVLPPHQRGDTISRPSKAKSRLRVTGRAFSQ